MKTDPIDDYATYAARVLESVKDRKLTTPEERAREVNERELRGREVMARDRAFRAEMKERMRVENERRASDCIRRTLPPPTYKDLVEKLDASKEATLIGRAWLGGSERGLILRGPKGVGKTLAAADIVAEVIRSGKRSVSWHRPDDFTSGILHSYDESAPRIGSDLIVIDEFGDESKVEFAQALRRFLDSSLTRFVLTTNLKQETCCARYAHDPRLLDRLDSMVQAFNVVGESLRAKKGSFL